MTDEDLWHLFTTQQLTHAEWNHAAHVRTAFLHLARNGFDVDEAHLRMRAGIIRLNACHGLTETSSRGYFETLSRAWMALVADAARRSGADESRAMLERCPELSDKSLALRHYSPELLASRHARSVFVEPDLSPLPR